ncbi:MAG: DUF4160 domain-containing protein [Neobacillus sp.]
MPCICQFGGMTIYIYFDDREPPHFHVKGQEKTRIHIITGEYLKGDNPLSNNKERTIQIWLEKNRNDIKKAWDDCRKGIMPQNIPPLY